MVDAGTHPNIELLTYAEVDSVDGYIGNFDVKIRKKQSYIDWQKCTGCGDCAEACPVRTPNEYNAGLDNRSAAYIHFPQAVPKKAVIDMDACINCGGRKIGRETRISKKTGKPILAPCERSCPAGAIDRSIPVDPGGDILNVKVGTIVVATGYKVMEKETFKSLAPDSPNVLTALQLERLISATGPTGGKFLRPSDNEKPKTISFLSCVGSRDEKHHTYCSRVCCMYMIKQAKLLKEKYPDLNIYMHFMDVRTPGKDFDEYYTGALEMGIKIIRGRVGGIDMLPEDRLKVMAYDADLAQNIEIDADLVVLATAIELQDDIKPLAQKLSLTLDGSGFFKELHPKLKPVETAVEGVFLAGCCQGPKDIPGTAAAAAAPLAWATVSGISISEVNREKCSGCGICEPLCPYGAITMAEFESGHKRAIIEMTQCKGCGVCTTACPSAAIELHGYSEDQIMAQIAALTL